MRFMHQKFVSLSQCKKAIIGASHMHMHNGWSMLRRGYVNESERVFYMRKKMTVTCVVSYGGLQAAYIKNCGLGVESYQVVEGTMDDDFFPWDDLLCEYAKKKMMIEARQLCDIMPDTERSTVSWHVVILGYIKIGNMFEAQILFQSFPKEGTVRESMMYGYGLHGMKKLIDKIINNECPELFMRNMLMWHMLIAGFCRGGRHDEAIIDMIWGGQMPKSLWGDNLATRNLWTEGLLYNNTRYTVIIDELIFGCKDVNKNAMSWNLIIGAEKRFDRFYAEKFFRKMPATLRNSHSWNLAMALQCTDDFSRDDRELEKAASIFHLHMPEEEQNVASWNALIYAYLQNQNFDEALLCFDYIKGIRNPHSWGLIIAGYLCNGMFDEAERMFFDNKIRTEDDLHSWVLMILWFVKDKKTIEQGRRFLINNVPKRPLSFYSIACACIKHGLRQEAKLVLECMQEALGTALNMHQVTKFMRYIEETEKVGRKQRFGLKCCKYKRRMKLMYNKYETHSPSDAFMQMLDSEVDANGDFSPAFLKGSWDCCGALQL